MRTKAALFAMEADDHVGAVVPALATLRSTPNLSLQQLF